MPERMSIAAAHAKAIEARIMTFRERAIPGQLSLPFNRVSPDNRVTQQRPEQTTQGDACKTAR